MLFVFILMYDMKYFLAARIGLGAQNIWRKWTDMFDQKKKVLFSLFVRYLGLDLFVLTGKVVLNIS